MEQPWWCLGWGCNDTPSPSGGALHHQTAQWCRVLPSCCCLGSDSWCDPSGCRAWEEERLLDFNPQIKSCSMNRIYSGSAYTSHGIPPIKTLTSFRCPVLSAWPVMVREEPPALGPLWGKMLLSTGFWREKRDQAWDAKNKSVIDNSILRWRFIGKIKRKARAFWETLVVCLMAVEGSNSFACHLQRW